MITFFPTRKSLSARYSAWIDSMVKGRFLFNARERGKSTENMVPIEVNWMYVSGLLPIDTDPKTVSRLIFWEKTRILSQRIRDVLD